MTFLQELHQQRWDDHRYYHHSRINQALHLVSACCFLASYVLIFTNPVLAVMVGWLLAMILRQIGHFFFEPKTYDTVNDATHEYKESVKVGYNLQRKVVLLSIWFAVPFVLYFQPSFFGFFNTQEVARGLLYNTSILWLFVGIGAVLFRMGQLLFIKGAQPALVWGTKILTDPFHDIKIYHKAPYYLFKGAMYDDMTEWYSPHPTTQQAS
ncbi:Mpo1-like protein [Nevskia soli]|uniref:Mpo1-like protein n=1 Tax=Nevskia soli TaxID=418856 RepID=UPI0004A75541|nr:Mpo1-like protein [Nevskia soli]